MKANTRLNRNMILACLLLVFNTAGVQAAEFRAFWADAWHAGLRNSAEVAAMVTTAKNSNYNAIFVEVRKRGDCYYFPTPPNIEPRASDIASDYDPLADIITQAHAQNIQVHAWVVAMHIWSDQNDPPASPNHVFNLHPEWLTKNSAGSTYISGYYLDPGVPDAMTWNYNVCMDLVQHYDIDGLHLDYIRYPQQDSGFNDIAVARFNAEYGRTGKPSSTDVVFSEWRRRQVTDFVKRVYVNTIAIKPNVVVSAATFGSRTDAYGYRFQDWVTWMQKGYLDANAPMGYSTDNAIFVSRTDDAYNNRFGRHLYKGQGSYLNTIANSMYQLGYIREKGCEGMITYSYQSTNSENKPNSEFYNTLKSQLFSASDTIPTMPWKTSPSEGILKGNVTSTTGTRIYNAVITLGTQTDKSDGTGFYALTKLSPGTWSVTCDAAGYISTSSQVTITAGSVTALNFVLAGDTTPPVISNVATSGVFANSATVIWDTNEGTTSQVEYGPTISYGNQTAENTALVTNHSVLLTGLTPNTLYHYRVKSKDGNNNLSVSGDYTFTTAQSGVVEDIIIDNNDATRVTLEGTWSTGTSSSDKYGSDYNFASAIAPPETKSFRWTPNILTPGYYEVSIWYPQGTNRNTGSAFTVDHHSGNQTFYVNQTTGGGQWNSLGSFYFSAGTGGSVKLSNATTYTGNVVIADAVKFVYQQPTWFLIESRNGGQNYAWYSDVNMTNSTAKSTAVGCTASIGSRYQTTNLKTGTATFQPQLSPVEFPGNGYYQASVTWPNASSTLCANTRATIHYDASWGGSGSSVIYLNQSAASGNQWVTVGSPMPYTGTDDNLVLDDQVNTTNNSSYRFLADAAKFDYYSPLPPSAVTASQIERYRLTLSWMNTSFDFGSVRIYRSTVSGQLGSLRAQNLTGSSFTDTGLTAGTTYYYTLKTLSGGRSQNESPNTNQIAVTTLDPPALFSTTINTGWNLVALPADPENPDPLVVLDEIDVPNSSLQYWQNEVDGGGYQSYGQLFGWTGPLMVGVPCWFMEYTGPKTISFQGDEKTGDVDINIPAHASAPYWIMFGQPFNHNTWCADVTFNTPSNPAPLGWTDAYYAGIVESAAQCFKNGTFISTGPPPFLVEYDRLEPWRGYWLMLRVTDPVTITIPVSPVAP